VRGLAIEDKLLYDSNRDSKSLELQIASRASLSRVPDNTICNSQFIRVAFLSLNMIPRNKKIPKIINSRLNQEQFLAEHNRLSPTSLGATISLLSRFKIEKTALFQDNSWSIEKLRRPFIFWLTSLTPKEKERINEQA
jgi:hypothetical protein